MSSEYDAIIIGSGSNGFAAAIYLQQKGYKTAIFEQSETIGGATKTEEATLPGFKHDIGSAIHPLTYDSPFFRSLPLQEHGLIWVFPEIPFAHPFSDGDAYSCYKSIGETANQLGKDRDAYINIFQPLLEDWAKIEMNVLGPLKFPTHPFKLVDFGFKAFLSAKAFVDKNFKEEKTKILFYGSAAHSTLPLNSFVSASFGLVLNILAHKTGWPFPMGGANKIIHSLSSYYQMLGGKIYINSPVENIYDLPKAHAYLFDLTPKQILKIKGTKFSAIYRNRLSNYRYGAGVFKMDWALSDPIPFINDKCKKAGTVHLGFSTKEIEDSEEMVHKGEHPDRPYVLLSQHSVFDQTRAPEGKHTAWAYCHVPNGSQKCMVEAIENQIERAVPGFKDCVLQRSFRNTAQMELFNPNLVGGDINGGKQDIFQLFTRPVARISPYSTPDPRVFICSSSTPPGGGVHGMCGYFAAREAIKKRLLY